MTESRFAIDTAVTHVGDGRFSARIDSGWWIMRGPNGGYVAAILLRALQIETGDPQRAPRSLTVHFLSPPEEGPIEIETRVERSGRSLSTVSARMTQQGRPIAQALCALSAPRPGRDLVELEMPDVLPPEQCPEIERRIPIHDRYEVRWAYGDRPFSASDSALSGGWIRLREPRVADAPLVAAYSDSLPPSLFSVLADGESTRGVPTVDLTVHFRAALPLPDATPDEWTLAVFRSRYARDGFVEEDGELWSPSGRLLAQSRQLAVLL
jgi:acyl-CoA thioesterase